MADDVARVIWSLTASGIGTAITATGNSGGYTATATPYRSAVDLRMVDDVWFSVNCGTVSGTSPHLTISLNAFDDQGNLFNLMALTALTAQGSQIAFGGRHGGGGSGTYFVPSEWGQVSWVVTGTSPVFSGLEICLYGR